jgi:predicted Fe-Mo cluster-binding NifX family protein
MRIAISADDNNGLDSIVSPHFGRCPHYILVDLEGQEVQGVDKVDNPFFGQHAPGQVPGFIHSHGVNVMLTGGMGYRAIGFFQQYGVEPVTGAAGTVRQALQRYLGGALSGAAPCAVSSEHAHEDEQQDTGEYEKDEVGRLREEADMLQQQLADVMARLDRLGGVN